MENSRYICARLKSMAHFFVHIFVSCHLKFHVYTHAEMAHTIRNGKANGDINQQITKRKQQRQTVNIHTAPLVNYVQRHSIKINTNIEYERA